MELKKLFDGNKKWAEAQKKQDPMFFERLSHQQSPKYLWIGCADSRVPANQILGLEPGEVFVHRNIGNLVLNSDINCLSVIEYAVKVLKVEHIIVGGHYGCGGVQTALQNTQMGLIDNWLRNIKDIYSKHKSELDELSKAEREDKMCELNVLSQVEHVCHTTVVQNAWNDGQKLSVHGLIYSLNDGILKDLAVRITSADQLRDIYKVTV